MLTLIALQQVLPWPLPAPPLLAEKDSSGDLLWVWSFPTVQEDLRDVLLRRCTLLAQDTAEEGQLQSLFGHFDKLWYYIQRTLAENIPRVS